jgi:uncharacterized phage-associated protein
MSISKQYDSVLGAKLLLALAYEKGIVLNTTKVQKMLYILYSYYMAKHDIQIFSETPKAWPYGPVFPRTRKKVEFGIVYKRENSDLSKIIAEDGLVDKFNSVIDIYSKFTAGQLSDWSHMKDSPWEKTTKLFGFKWGDFIPDNYIKEYFSNLDI